MQLEIFNTELLQSIKPDFSLSLEDISSGYERLFLKNQLEKINIVFVSSEYIQELNSKYRGINTPTDVLSYSMLGSKKDGEIYICPEYIYTSFSGDEFEEEILRLIIHGTLHILGYDHMESLNDSPDEDMFKLQEKLLLCYKKICS